MSFLATKDHFSSNWTSVVVGGKSHELVVELAGVAAGEPGVAGDGLAVDFRQPGRLAGADALGEVLEDGECLAVGEAGVEPPAGHLVAGRARARGADPGSTAAAS